MSSYIPPPNFPNYSIQNQQDQQDSLNDLGESVADAYKRRDEIKDALQTATDEKARRSREELSKLENRPRLVNPPC